MCVDAIVNSTNEEMIAYSGVDRAIHEAAGEELALECQGLAPLELGTAVITKGYRLPAKYVIHTSGPRYVDGRHGESLLLHSSYLSCLKLATEKGLQTVAFPLISSGAYGYPKEQVLTFAVKTISEYLEENELTVYLCVYDRQSYTFSKSLYSDIRSFLSEEPECDDFTMRFERRSRRMDLPLFDREDDGESYSRSSILDDWDFGPPTPAVPPSSAKGKTLEEYMRQLDRSFAEMLFFLIDERGMSDVECYKRANVDKRIFSKIRSNKDYRPSKPTAIAFAISLKLDLDTTQHLLATAGFTLSRSFVFDKIILYFIQNGRYDIFEINEALFEFDQPLLGAV